MLLDYVATYLNDGICYHKRGMKIAAHADAGYLNVTNPHRRSGDHIFLLEQVPIPQFNGAVLAINGIIKFVISLAAKAELAGLLITSNRMVPIRQT